MISSDVDAAPRSLADQLSDLSQRFDHDNEGMSGHNNASHETNSHKIQRQRSSKLTPAAFQYKYGSGRDTDVNSVAITNKPGQSYGKYTQDHAKKHSKTPADLGGKKNYTTKDFKNQLQGPNELQYEQMRYPVQIFNTRFDNENFGNFAESLNNEYPVAVQSRAEIDLQLRDLEYKIRAADRKQQESFSELSD